MIVMKNIILPDIPLELVIYVEGKDEKKLKKFLKLFGELWNREVERANTDKSKETK